MTIAVEPLQTIEEMRSAVALQRSVLGEHAREAWTLPQLLDVEQSGGLLLGAHETTAQGSSALHGILVDLVADVDRYPSRRTVAWGVHPRLRNRGIGLSLREAERRTHQGRGVDLVVWDVDPLLSSALHISLNKLGGIATAYRQDVLGGARDAQSPGLATDRLRIEWWIDSPRVIGMIDRHLPPPHHHVGLHEMTVLTKTRILQSGVRTPIGEAEAPSASHVLVEIPEVLGEMQMRDYEAAIQWRLQTRGVLRTLFDLEYLGVGLVHEGGRSFLLFKKGTRRTELQAADRL
jgi:predicted GNAT superfamily acetyltransferase